MKKTILLFAVILQVNCYSQNDISALNKIIANDSASSHIIFNYPDSIRNAALIASTYPQGFSRLSEIQKKTSTSFKNLISTYSRNKQKQLWDISRYPQLTTQLIDNRDKKKEELQEVLKNYPKQTREAAIHFAKHDYNVIIQMKNIQVDFESKYEDALTNFPADVKKSYNKLLHYPEVVSALSEDMNTTETLGDLYKKNPPSVKRVMDSVYQKNVNESNAEYADWKKGIKTNPAVQNELQELSKKYKEDQEYEDDIYATKQDTTRNTSTQEQVAPYPYWAGYPSWYDFPYWYPYPSWYSTGFFWYPNGPFFWGMPSYHFGYWYYNHPYYSRRYPNAGNYFYNHYQGHARSNNGFTRSVREWNGGGNRGSFNGARGGFGGGRSGGGGGARSGGGGGGGRGGGGRR
jgi:adenylate kinase family enzyme